MKKYIEFEAIDNSGYGFYVTLQNNEVVAYSETQEEYFNEETTQWNSADCTEVITRNEAVYIANIPYDEFRRLF